MTWLVEEIKTVDLESSGDVWERFLAAMVAYWNESFPYEINHAEWNELYRDRIRRRLDEHPTWLWMYEREGRTLALTDFHLDSGVAHVAEVWVLPEMRRHGLGRFMIRQMRQTLCDAGVTRMAVTVPSNATQSIGFWRNLGFTEIAVQLEASTYEGQASTN
jgi:ribosomal protein S18 acetylase RimI-like enzyme